MQELFEGRQLHPITQTVLCISQWLNAYGKTLFLILSFTIAGSILLLRRPSVQLKLQKAILKIPFCKSLIIHSGLARFTRTVSLLLAGGIPLVEALALSRKAMKHPVLEEVIEDAEKKIIEGQRLSARLKLSPLIPSLVPRMIAIAEEAGNMEQMMKNIAEIYEEDLEKSLAQLTTFLQPALLIFLGGVVGLVVLSILLPLTDVSSFLAT
jgi:general secretion pathway protein F/type IV pilus assembly protein PilC